MDRHIHMFILVSICLWVGAILSTNYPYLPAVLYTLNIILMIVYFADNIYHIVRIRRALRKLSRRIKSPFMEGGG